ncbi:MAG: hypothetical protein O7E52_20005 [Candidatus Poribacteria bacterium]|nr:hypothetical protein [Candidatus Poribacteria bacterium]
MIPVYTLEITEITILSGESGNEDFGQQPKPNDPVKAFGVGEWRSKKNMPKPRGYLSSIEVDGKIYAIGGAPSGDPVLLSTVEEYDPASDTWTEGATIPTPRILLATSAVQGKIYAIGGDGEPPDYLSFSTVEEFDPKDFTSSVEPEGKLPTLWGEVKALR